MELQLVILGLGARSTLYYQKQLHALYLKKNQEYATCPFTVKQIDFNRINSYLPDGKEKIVPVIIQELEPYDNSKTFLLVPNFTLHAILDTINFQLNIVHPLQILKNIISTNEIKKAVIFATKYSYNSPYILACLKQSNTNVISLSEDEIVFLDELRKRVYSSLETKKDYARYNMMLNEYSKENLIIICCTELSVINNNHNPNILDLSKLQCQEAINLL